MKQLEGYELYKQAVNIETVMSYAVPIGIFILAVVLVTLGSKASKARWDKREKAGNGQDTYVPWYNEEDVLTMVVGVTGVLMVLGFCISGGVANKLFHTDKEKAVYLQSVDTYLSERVKARGTITGVYKDKEKGMLRLEYKDENGEQREIEVDEALKYHKGDIITVSNTEGDIKQATSLFITNEYTAYKAGDVVYKHEVALD